MVDGTKGHSKYKERQEKKAARLTAKAEKRETRTARWQNEALIKLGTGKYARKRAEKAEAKAAAGSRKAWKRAKKNFSSVRPLYFDMD